MKKTRSHHPVRTSHLNIKELVFEKVTLLNYSFVVKENLTAESDCAAGSRGLPTFHGFYRKINQRGQKLNSG